MYYMCVQKHPVPHVFTFTYVGHGALGRPVRTGNGWGEWYGEPCTTCVYNGVCQAQCEQY
jgi:hypothetical protein